MAVRSLPCLLSIPAFLNVVAAQPQQKVDFGRDVQPIFRQHCYSCHGPSQQMRGLRLDRRRAAMPNRVGANRASIVAGNSEASLLYLKLVGKASGLQMPPDGQLQPEQIRIVKTWIDQGAEWPDELAGEAQPSPPDPAAQRLMDALRDGERERFLALLRENPGAARRAGARGSTPLMYAVLYGDADSVRLLLEDGAEPNVRNGANVTALLYAVDDPEKTRLLLEHGADASVRSDEGQTATQIAARLPESEQVIELLRGHGAAAQALTASQPHPAVSARAAIERSLPLLQRADVAFLQKAGCVSCHSNSLAEMATAAVRRSGIRVDEQIVRSQLQMIAAFLEGNRERALQGLGLPGAWDTVSYILAGLAAEKYPADEITDGFARYLKDAQLADGHWPIRVQRPPLESSDFTVTALSMRALQAYAPKAERRAYAEAVERAARWLETAQPDSTEDRAFQILGFAWAGGKQESMRRAAQSLLRAQRADGGWAQLPVLASDAYATGQVLFALSESGALAPTSPEYTRGVRFLMNSQDEDGSWFVESRARPVQPYFDSGFPHGANQFISAAATNWAVMALAAAAR